MMSHIFPCNSDKDKATNKNYPSNERKFHTFYEMIPKNWMIEALESLKLIYCNLAISCNFFSTNLETIENINFYIFPCNSNKN